MEDALHEQRRILKDIEVQRTSFLAEVRGIRQRTDLEAQEIRQHAERNAQQLRQRTEQEVKAAQEEVKADRFRAAMNLKSARDELNLLLATMTEESVRAQRIRAELRQVEEEEDIHSFAFYHAHYNFDSAGAYAAQLDRLRDQQKKQLKERSAVEAPDNFTMNGSKAQGKKVIGEAVKLMLRAFNGECDAAISSVRYNNIATLEKRIQKSYTDINTLGKTKEIRILPEYLDLKLQELRLVHEHREKLQAEKEEQQRIREELREEAKARAELERAQSEAEKEEQRYQKALDKARNELQGASQAKHDVLQAQIAELEARLAEASEQKQRAISQAQLTKSGHVYIISNVGSFGENVYKIGMTRRLDPMERVHELGDASVPFRFDVHAMIYTEDAPGLENMLHQHFAHRRLNRINLRREFFHVTLDEVRHVVKQRMGDEAEFVSFPEAEEFRKSMAMMQEEAA